MVYKIISTFQSLQDLIEWIDRYFNSFVNEEAAINAVE